MARLMIVTQYAGSKTVKVYAVEADTEMEMGTKAGFISSGDDPETTNNVALKSVGTYYPAGDVPFDVTDDVTEGLLTGDHVAAAARGKEVFSYTEPNATVKSYVVVATTTTTGDTTPTGDAITTYNYRSVVIHIALEADGDTAITEVHEVTAKIPEATDYKHIHFGVWAALGDPDKGGTQKLSDLGIGFVQNFSGEGLTTIGGGSDDMPNGGDAMYKGDWAAAVQAADGEGNGAITLLNNPATLTANFGKATISADLTGLATLTGDIAGNTFSGTKAKLAGMPMGGLTAADFTGTFSGGFYGAKAAEAGGIFDFTSEDAEAGAFRGAFGGDKK